MAWALECDVCAHTCLKRDFLEENLEKDSIVECSRTARYTTNTVQFGRRLGGRRARALPYPEGMAPEPYTTLPSIRSIPRCANPGFRYLAY